VPLPFSSNSVSRRFVIPGAVNITAGHRFVPGLAAFMTLPIVFHNTVTYRMLTAWGRFNTRPPFLSAERTYP
jgi:hypothetical protein